MHEVSVSFRFANSQVPFSRPAAISLSSCMNSFSCGLLLPEVPFPSQGCCCFCTNTLAGPSFGSPGKPWPMSAWHQRSDCRAHRRMLPAFSLAAGRAAWVLAAYHVLTTPVGFREPSELLHESVPHGAPGWEAEGLSWWSNHFNNKSAGQGCE